MERYSYLQTMPNSPLTPLTPLSDNIHFEFNFAGDGSLNDYIDSVRQEHRVEHQRKKLLQQANETYQKELCPATPRRYSGEFLKIEGPVKHECKQTEAQISPMATPKVPVVKKEYCGNTPKQTSSLDYANTPTNIRKPLQLRNNNVRKNLTVNTSTVKGQQRQQMLFNRNMQLKKKAQQDQKKANKIFLQTSPVALKPLCPQVANILQKCGLVEYSDIFQREEIDLLAFRLLRQQDMHELGITKPNHCAILMKSIQYVRHHM